MIHLSDASLLAWLPGLIHLRSVTASVGYQKSYFLKLFMLVKKTSTHLPPERMDLRQSTTQPPHFMPERKFAWAALKVMTKSGNPGSVSAAKSSLSVAQVRLMFWGKHYPPNCVTPSHPCKGLEVPLAPWAHRGMCRKQVLLPLLSTKSCPWLTCWCSNFREAYICSF